MLSRDPGPFVILRARLLTGAIWFEYQDSRGETRTPGQPGYVPVAVSAAGTSGWPGAPILWAPSDLAVLRKGMIEEAERGQQSGKGPATLPMFAAKELLRRQISDLAYGFWEQRGRPHGSPEADWFRAEAQIGTTDRLWSFDPATLVERLPAVAAEWGGVEVVRLARDTWQRRSPFCLPLVLQPVGAEAAEALDVIASHSWYQDPDVREFGLVLSPPAAPDQVCGSLPPVIVICTPADIAAVLRAVWIAPSPQRPRLILVLGDVPIASSDPLPEGISLLVIPLNGAGAPDFLNEFLYGIIHDNPLPSALKSAMWAYAHTVAGPPRLISDPAAIHDLRLKDALTTVLHEALQLRSASRRRRPGLVCEHTQV